LGLYHHGGLGYLASIRSRGGGLIMAIKMVTYVLPSYLAPALINGDMSGMDEVEAAYLGDWNAEKVDEHGGLFHCVNVEDYGYTRENDYDNLAGDCAHFTFHVNEV
jgi:hypothetical protein